MEHQKLTTLQKWYLKYTNRPAYNDYKMRLKEQAFYDHAASFQHPSLKHPYKQITGFLHSGNSGDIIYSLPAVYELSKKGKAHLYLQVNQPTDQEFSFHPLGNVMLNDKMIALLQPLLLHQPQIAIAEKYKDQSIDYNLDDFRKHKNFISASITHWYFTTYGISYDTSKPWLTAPKDERYSNTIIIARSHRYRQPLIDYSFLKNYENKLFVGVPEEYADMEKVLPGLEYKPVNDFLEMATVINSCRLFIGNQSFPFSLAEALKVPRLLEVYYKVPNVITEGKGANHFMYQPQFEYAVKRLLEETAGGAKTE
jgi:hypothetical protein